MRHLCICLILGGLSGWGAEPINLVPRVKYRELAGIHFPQLEFTGNRQTITYEPPAGWRVSSATKRMLKLYPGNFLDAEVSIEATETGVTADYSDSDAVLSRQIPEESEDAQRLDTDGEPLQIAGKAARELNGEFTFFGRRFRVNVLIVEVGTATFTFRLTALTPDFARLYPKFRNSLYTWEAAISPEDSAGKIVFRTPGPAFRGGYAMESSSPAR